MVSFCPSSSTQRLASGGGGGGTQLSKKCQVGDFDNKAVESTVADVAHVELSVAYRDSCRSGTGNVAQSSQSKKRIIFCRTHRLT